MVGDKVQIKSKRYFNSNEVPQIFEGRVVFENAHYTTVQTKNYLTSVNRYDCLIGQAEIKKVL